jgi:hypothetical protein
MVVYTPNNNPDVTRGTQGDPSQGTWNNNGQQQQPNGSAAGPSRGVLELSERAPVQAIEADVHSTATTTISNLTTPSFYQAQVGSGHHNCMHVPSNSYCILCDQQEVILHTFLTSQNEQDNTKTKQALDLLPCSLAIVKYIQRTPSTSTSVPF